MPDGIFREVADTRRCKDPIDSRFAVLEDPPIAACGFAKRNHRQRFPGPAVQLPAQLRRSIEAASSRPSRRLPNGS